jgi:hypothetical protein
MPSAGVPLSTELKGKKIEAITLSRATITIISTTTQIKVAFPTVLVGMD